MFREEIRKKYYKIYGNEFLRACTRPLNRSIRVNTLLTNKKEVESRLKKQRFELKKGLVDNSFEIKRERFSIGSSIEHLSGMFFIQESTSMIPPIWLDPKPTDTVLDAFASPGGKTTHLAALMKNKGSIIAIDSDKRKHKAMVQNLDRMNVTNTTFIEMNAKNTESLGIKFDKILMDAPCTGSGIIYKDKGIMEKLNISLIESYASKQKELITKITPTLKKGGMLAYSTCSVNPEENQRVTDYAINKLRFKLIKEKQYLPHIDNTPGFYVSLLKKL